MRGAVVGRFIFPAMQDSYMLINNFLEFFMLSDTTNEFLQCLSQYEEQLANDKQNATRAKRLKRSKLEAYRLEILTKKASGKSFQQIADYLLNTHRVKCDRTTVFDFYIRCISE